MAIDIVQLKSDSEMNLASLEKTLSVLLNAFDIEQDLTCILTDDAHIHQLNRDFRQKDTPTDVLSFEMSDDVHPASPLGEVYISIDRAHEQAQQAGHTSEHEVRLLAIHGSLHLLGFEHETEEGYKQMRAQELKYLNNHQMDNNQLKGV